jgi:hypothetical protein
MTLLLKCQRNSVFPFASAREMALERTLRLAVKPLSSLLALDAICVDGIALVNGGVAPIYFYRAPRSVCRVADVRP